MSQTSGATPLSVIQRQQCREIRSRGIPSILSVTQPFGCQKRMSAVNMWNAFQFISHLHYFRDKEDKRKLETIARSSNMTMATLLKVSLLCILIGRTFVEELSSLPRAPRLLGLAPVPSIHVSFSESPAPRDKQNIRDPELLDLECSSGPEEYMTR